MASTAGKSLGMLPPHNGQTADTNSQLHVVPFAGGTAFVATQAVGWSAFAATIVMIALLLQQVVAGVARCVRCWAVGAGATMMLAQLVSRSQFIDVFCLACVRWIA